MLLAGWADIALLLTAGLYCLALDIAADMAILDGITVDMHCSSKALLTAQACCTTCLMVQVDVKKDLWPAIEICVAWLFRAVLPLLNPSKLLHCYELFGLDFMVNAEGQVSCHLLVN